MTTSVVVIETEINASVQQTSQSVSLVSTEINASVTQNPTSVSVSSFPVSISVQNAVPVSVSVTSNIISASISNVASSGGSSSVSWGGILGTLSNQIDLQNALNAKVSIAGDTMTGPLRIGSVLYPLPEFTVRVNRGMLDANQDYIAYIRNDFVGVTGHATLVTDVAHTSAASGILMQQLGVTKWGVFAYGADLVVQDAVDSYKRPIKISSGAGTDYFVISSSGLAVGVTDLTVNKTTHIVSIGTSISLPASGLVMNSQTYNLTGGGTVALGGFTLTVPATGTAALLATANVFTAIQKINVNSTAAFLVEQDGVKDDVLVVDTTNGVVSIGTPISSGFSPAAIKLTVGGDIITGSCNVYFDNDRGFVSKTNTGTYRDIFYASTTNQLIFGATAAGWADIQFRIGSTVPVMRLLTSGSPSAHFIHNQTTNGVVREVQRLEARISTASTGGAIGFGVSQGLWAETATDLTNKQQGRLWSKWIIPTNGSEAAAVGLDAYYNSTAQEFISGEATTTAVMLAFFGGTRAIQQVLNAYTSDGEGNAYTGIDNLQAGTVYATVADLNTLRGAYETLRASYDDLRTKLQTSTLVG